MLSTSIGWILIVSGLVTAVGGLTALVSPQPFLRLGFGVKSIDGATVFFTRYWGLLICLIAALIVYSAYVPTIRIPVLIVAAIEKCANVIWIFFGPVKRTTPMSAIAITDGVFAILYIAYLAGL